MVDHRKVHLMAQKNECKIRLHDLRSIWYNKEKFWQKKRAEIFDHCKKARLGLATSLFFAWI